MVTVNVLMVSLVALLVAYGSLPIMPWVAVTSIAILALDAIILRNRAHVNDGHKTLFHSQSSLFSKGGKLVLSLLATACFLTILSSVWRIAPGKVELPNLIQIVASLLLLWLTISVVV